MSSSQNPEKESVLDSNSKINGIPSNLETGHPKESVEEATRAVNLDLPKNSFHLKPDDLRKNFNVLVSGDLAKGLWLLLGGVVVVHLIATIAFSWLLTNKPDVGDTEEKRTARIEKAMSNVNDTSKVIVQRVNEN